MNEQLPGAEFEEKIREAVGTPAARLEFVARLRNELAQKPVKTKPQFQLKLVWALAIAAVILALIASAPTVVKALRRLFGYVPDVGMVENTGSLRMLAQPVSLTREGVTLTITNVLAYPDHVELIYEVKGIEPSNDGYQAQNANEDPKAFCGPQSSFDGSYLSDGDAALRLPDGTTVKRMFGNEYPQNVYAMKPVYKVALPADVTELTMVLKCIPEARLGAVPETWEVPFKLAAVPAGTVVGVPVVFATATPEPVETQVASPTAAVASHPISLALDGTAQLDTATIFYIHLEMQNPDPSLISVMPANVYVIDSQGQHIVLIPNFPWQPYQFRPGSKLEYRSQSKPAVGPLTVVVEKAIAYYAPMYVDAPQASPEQMSFTFDAGENPQRGQSWGLDEMFEIAGYPIKVTSVRAVNFEDTKVPGVDYSLGSQGYEYGYEFKVQADPSVKMHVAMDIVSESPICWLSNVVSDLPTSSSMDYAQLCRDAYPRGVVKVTIRELSVLEDSTWEAGGVQR